MNPRLREPSDLSLRSNSEYGCLLPYETAMREEYSLRFDCIYSNFMTSCRAALKPMLAFKATFVVTQQEGNTMSKLLSLMVGVAVIAISGSANAGGPVVLADAQMDQITAGQTAADLLASNPNGVNFAKTITSTTVNNVTFLGQSNITETLQKTALILAASNVVGNSTALAFDNEAIGPNSHTQGDFSQVAIAGVGSSQSGNFVAAANP